MDTLQVGIRDNLILMIILVLITLASFTGLSYALIRFSINYTSLRERRKRALVKALKAHMDLQYVEFDDGMGQLEASVDHNLSNQLKKLQQSSAVPEAVRQAARVNKGSQLNNSTTISTE